MDALCSFKKIKIKTKIHSDLGPSPGTGLDENQRAMSVMFSVSDSSDQMNCHSQRHDVKRMISTSSTRTVISWSKIDRQTSGRLIGLYLNLSNQTRRSKQWCGRRFRVMACARTLIEEDPSLLLVAHCFARAIASGRQQLHRTNRSKTYPRPAGYQVSPADHVTKWIPAEHAPPRRNFPALSPSQSKP